MALTVWPLGVGDAFSARWYSSCLAIEADGAWLLVDCPHPIRKILAESSDGLDIHNFEAVVLTHLHADHASGIEGFAFFSWFVLKRRVALVAHPEVANALWPRNLAASMHQLIDAESHEAHAYGFEDYFTHQALVEDAPVQVGPFTIECRKTIHHIPTTALRIHAGGRTLGYSADTAFDPDLIAWLAEADLIIHETNYGAHTPYARLAGLPESIRSKMRLIHYPDDFAVEASGIECLTQGVPIDV